MATTKATASTHVRLFLLAAILLAVASVQARGDSMPPPPAMAPSPAGGGCPPDKVAELRECFESSPMGGVRLPRTLDGLRRCCRLVRAQVGLLPGGGFVRPAPSADAVECLCSAFSNSSDPSLINNDVNTVLTICGEAQVPGVACSSTRSVTV
ncbi:unnamed protein product [Alopecurus aequalis]